MCALSETRMPAREANRVSTELPRMWVLRCSVSDVPCTRLVRRLPPLGLFAVHAEPEGEAVLELDNNPTRTPSEGHAGGAVLALVRADRDTCRVAGHSKMVNIYWRVQALRRECGRTHVESHTAVESDRDPRVLAGNASQFQHEVGGTLTHFGNLRFANDLSGLVEEVQTALTTRPWRVGVRVTRRASASTEQHQGGEHGTG